jgi:hypothetical protein
MPATDGKAEIRLDFGGRRGGMRCVHCGRREVTSGWVDGRDWDASDPARPACPACAKAVRLYAEFEAGKQREARDAD